VAAVVAVAVLVALAGCSVRRVESGVFQSPKGYRVAIPGSAWAVAEKGGADLELRHRAEPLGMLAHAECQPRLASRGASALERNLLIGLRDRAVVERADAVLDGRPATRLVLDAAVPGSGRLRIEAWTMSDGRCVYDLVYAAAPERFQDTYPAFERFVSSFARQAR
jgi:hypothetical protein